LQREDLTGDDPSNRTPGGSEECNIEANEGDENFLTSNIPHRDGDTDDGDDVFAQTHSNGTDDKQTATTETLNTPHSRNGHDHIDNVGDNSNDEWVIDTGILEESGAVVEDEVDSGELLPRLNEDTTEGTESDLVLGKPEAVNVRTFTKGFFLLPY